MPINCPDLCLYIPEFLYPILMLPVWLTVIRGISSVVFCCWLFITDCSAVQWWHALSSCIIISLWCSIYQQIVL